jgi:hypothetical protein
MGETKKREVKTEDEGEPKLKKLENAENQR